MRLSPLTLAVLLGLTSVASSCSSEAPAETSNESTPRPRLVATQTLVPAPHQRTLPRKLGVLEAAERRQLSFEVSGRLLDVVDEGTAVTPDTVIARLDATMERAELRRSTLMRSDAEDELDRAKGLSKARAASQKELEAARIQLEMRDAELDMARYRLQQKSLRAEISGVVADVRAEPGELVLPQSPVLTVLDTSSLKLVIGVPGYQVTEVRRGSPVRVYVPSALSRPLAGTIERVAEAALPGEHLFEVEVRIPNPRSNAAESSKASPVARSASDPIQSEGDSRSSTSPDVVLRPGMNAWAELVTESFDSALVVPLEAMVEHAGERVVFFVEDGKALPVSVGAARVSDQELILPGDLPHRELVVRGQHDLHPGDAVRVDNRILDREREA